MRTARYAREFPEGDAVAQDVRSTGMVHVCTTGLPCATELNPLCTIQRKMNPELYT
jgi:hypothetical protein